MDCVWDGITRADTLNEPGASRRCQLAEAAKDYRWPEVIEIIQEDAALVNSSRPAALRVTPPFIRQPTAVHLSRSSRR